jgi:hypothetical protein
MSENDWLEPLDRRIKKVQKEIEDIKKETAALAALHRVYAENGDAMKRLADVEAWETYCEASLNLSNQDDVGEDTPWLDCADGFKDLSDEDADLIDSGFKAG